MALFPWLRRRPPPPVSPPPPPPHLEPLRLRMAPAYQPLPCNPADPVDIEVVRLWSAYQRTTARPTWPTFIAELTRTNTTLADELRRADAHLADYRRHGDFVP